MTKSYMLTILLSTAVATLVTARDEEPRGQDKNRERVRAAIEKAMESGDRDAVMRIFERVQKERGGRGRADDSRERDGSRDRYSSYDRGEDRHQNQRGKGHDSDMPGMRKGHFKDNMPPMERGSKGGRDNSGFQSGRGGQGGPDMDRVNEMRERIRGAMQEAMRSGDREKARQIMERARQMREEHMRQMRENSSYREGQGDRGSRRPQRGQGDADMERARQMRKEHMRMREKRSDRQGRGSCWTDDTNSNDRRERGSRKKKRNNRKGNNGVGNGEDPAPPGNPPVNDGYGTGPGNPGNRGGARR